MISCGCWYHRSIDIDASLDSISTLQASLFHYSFLFPGFMLVQKLLLLHHSFTVWGLFLSSDNSCMFFHVVSIWVSFRFSTPQPHNNSGRWTVYSQFPLCQCMWVCVSCPVMTWLPQVYSCSRSMYKCFHFHRQTFCFRLSLCIWPLINVLEDITIIIQGYILQSVAGFRIAIIIVPKHLQLFFFQLQKWLKLSAAHFTEPRKSSKYVNI